MYIAQKLPVSLKTDIYPKTNPLGVCDTAKLPLGRVEEALQEHCHSQPHPLLSSLPETAAA